MKLSKQNLQSKLNTWVKHVNRGDSKFFFEVNAYTGVTEENFIRELKWLFNDPQDLTHSQRPLSSKEIILV